jgi:two-component system sensor histidine kinase BaeS
MPTRPLVKPRHRFQLPLLGDMVEQGCFINLIENALRYTTVRRDPHRLRMDRDRSIITVTDTGIGIAAEHLPHIFQQFYRADSARSRESGGAGLGLAIAKEVIVQHGAEITVASQVGQGTAFTISFPMAGVQSRVARQLNATAWRGATPNCPASVHRAQHRGTE